MTNEIKCYLKCVNSTHSDISLPHNCPVVVGRMPELKITDKTCSRSQLQLTANYDRRYVLVKRLGISPSQIECIDIERHKSSRLNPSQLLHIVNMKYPHTIRFEGTGADSTHDDTTSSINTSGLPQKTKEKSRRPDFKIENDKNVLKKSRLDCEGNTGKSQSVSDSESEYSFQCMDNTVVNIPSGSSLNKPNSHSQKATKIADKPATHSDKSSENAQNKPKNVEKATILSSDKPVSKHWSQGLKASMLDPDFVILKDDLVVVIKDKYPKAKFHWLVLPVEDISTLNQLHGKHAQLLKHMLKIGEEMAENERQKNSSLSFRCGYHAVASMSRLHMHVISQDFSSTSLKTKKHWNSFTTEYFVDAKKIIEELERNGKIENRKSSTSFLNTPLKCHICNSPQKNMPSLKKHIEQCKA